MQHLPRYEDVSLRTTDYIALCVFTTFFGFVVVGWLQVGAETLDDLDYVEEEDVVQAGIPATIAHSIVEAASKLRQQPVPVVRCQHRPKKLSSF